MVLQVQDSAARAAALADTTSVRPDTLGAPPLPGGVATAVRAIFGAPTWLWLLVMGLATLTVMVVVWQTWRRRVTLWGWVASRPRGVKVTMAAGLAIVILLAPSAGAVSWNYVQHDNAFCVSCHVMTPAFQAMRTSTVHDTLGCHDCHQQSVFASAWQLYVWLKDRPDEIEQHARVPNTACTACHVTGTARERWQRVIRTAGHRVHLESDTSALDSVMCTTCHGEEVHRFVPADRTCGQAGCHRPQETRIAIGPMASQTSLHCITCHQYTAELPQLASLDSARGTMRPSRKQCFSCHAMQERLAEFDLARDPHGGQCGMCHNPHTQARPTEVLKSCTTAGCHDGWRDIPFHTGPVHRRASQQCATCHEPHAARVDASDCEGCHADVARRIPRLRGLPQGFDTTRALRRISWRHEDTRAPPPLLEKHAAARAAKPFEPGAVRPAPPRARTLRAAADTFEHARHRALACITCHAVRGAARLTFEPPRGCQICHHEGPSQSRCAACHANAELARPHAEVVTVTVRDRAPRQRAVTFRHDTHQGLACTTCHSTPVTLAPPDSVRACASCHDDHHDDGGSCAACHADPATSVAHAPPAEAHAGCDACHEAATVARLVPDRALCLTCHAAQREHVAGRDCATCHFLEDPASYRRRLVGSRS